MTESINPNFAIASRLVIKNIPENFSDENMISLLNKNFGNKVSNVTIFKLVHKYGSKNSKLCYLTSENLEVRKQVIDFFQNYTLINPKGFKIKLVVVDCLFQHKPKPTKDNIENTINNRII
jgi:hypothetical protein